MIIRSRDFTYRVIRQLAGSEGIAHYQCFCEQDREEYQLVRIPAADLNQTLLMQILELDENSAFMDLKEFFLEQEILTLVFCWPLGCSLYQYMEQASRSLNERFLLGQRIIERLLLQQTPDWLLSGSLSPQSVYPEQDPVRFLYLTGNEGPESGLLILFTYLFAQETAEDLYPEITDFLQTLTAENDLPEGENKLLWIYQQYLKLLPACGESRSLVLPVRESLMARGKRLGQRFLTGIKLLTGLTVLLAAVIMLPALWQENIVPVVEAAVLWKAVYVDGETLTAGPEPTAAETVAESPADPDNGQVVRYWENGKVSYRGNLADGFYDGWGTRYYANGLMEYQGEFLFGRKEGEGCLYTPDGMVLYEGGFKRDRFEGQGRLYDEKTGVLIYDGEFSGGKYSGAGFLFDPYTAYPKYDGTFRQGYYDGYGTEYGDNGARLYEGGFLLGVYHGPGIYYDTATGEVMLEGEFRNGLLIIPELPEDLNYDATPSDTAMKGGGEDEGRDFATVAPEKG